MFGNFQPPIYSNPTTQFTEALVTDAISANYDIGLPRSVSRVFINGFTIISKENCAWELWLFDRAVNLTSDPATDRLVGMWAFTALTPGYVGYTVTDGGVANPLFRYHVTGNMIPYLDRDYQDLTAPSTGPNLHVRLVNRAVAPKSADAAGAIQLISFISSQGVQA